MTYVDERRATTSAAPGRAWEFVSRLGGDERLYVPRDLWRARGLVDRLAGGPGHRVAGTGRPLRAGDPMDFWEVTEVHAPTRLRLRALAAMPGTAHLEITVAAHGDGSQLTLRTEFEPDGLRGHAFWWAELPAHVVVFELMARRLTALVSAS
jgi:hypothetical protein